MTAAGYAGSLADLRGHLVAKVEAARREMDDRPTHDAEIRYARAVWELERFDNEDGPAGGANPTTGPEESGDSTSNVGGVS